MGPLYDRLFTLSPTFRLQFYVPFLTPRHSHPFSFRQQCLHSYVRACTASTAVAGHNIQRAKDCADSIVPDVRLPIILTRYVRIARSTTLRLIIDLDTERRDRRRTNDSDARYTNDSICDWPSDICEPARRISSTQVLARCSTLLQPVREEPAPAHTMPGQLSAGRRRPTVHRIRS